ncbi:MAG: 16S rRNA processing protein RimM [Bacteroidetes bacterium]|nr:MAG: 16S rRNA processing protein RimM [Bacteroidota bacterium]
MTRAECVELGYVAKAHGLKGEVKVVFDVHDISEYGKGSRVFLAKKDEPLQPHKISQMRVLNERQAIVWFEGVTDRNQSEALRGSTLYFPESELPVLPEGHFYYFQIIGFDVEDEQLGRLGRVEAIQDGAAQDLLVMRYQGREVLIPLEDAFVGPADMQARVLHTRLPEGLLEMYLES